MSWWKVIARMQRCTFFTLITIFLKTTTEANNRYQYYISRCTFLYTHHNFFLKTSTKANNRYQGAQCHHCFWRQRLPSRYSVSLHLERKTYLSWLYTVSQKRKSPHMMIVIRWKLHQLFCVNLPGLKLALHCRLQALRPKVWHTYTYTHAYTEFQTSI